MSQQMKRPITRRALIQRINRKLEAKNEKLVAARGLYERSIGKYYVIDVTKNVVVRTKIEDLEEFGRELQAIEPFEREEHPMKAEFAPDVRWDDGCIVVDAKAGGIKFTCYVTPDRLTSGRVRIGEREARKLFDEQRPELEAVLQRRIEQKNYGTPEKIIVSFDWPY